MVKSLKHALLLLMLLWAGGSAGAERAADLPRPTSYVADFAGVLSPAGKQQIEDLSREVHDKANAELVVVTVKTLDDGQSVEDFAVQLAEKWKLGKTGLDRTAYIVLVMNPHKFRVETGYGLEGILNDAKVGAILDRALPFAKSGDFSRAALTADQGLATVVAADAKVTLTSGAALPDLPATTPPPQSVAPSSGFSVGHIVIGIGFLLLLILLWRTGNIGFVFLLLNMFAGGGGGGGGGGGRSDDDFGGSGGGGTGGGGASRDF